MPIQPKIAAGDLIAIGRITRTQGNAGAVRLLPFFSPISRIEDLRTKLTFAQSGTGPLRELHILSVSYHKQFAILHFTEIQDMMAAEGLRDTILYVREEDLWQLNDGEFFSYQLVGLRVVDEQTNHDIGTVLGVEDGAAHDYLRVQGTNREFRIPFVRAIISAIDFEEGVIAVNLPEGLEEL